MRKCDGGCLKEFKNDHPNAKVLCLECAMRESQELRVYYQKYFDDLIEFQKNANTKRTS